MIDFRDLFLKQKVAKIIEMFCLEVRPELCTVS